MVILIKVNGKMELDLVKVNIKVEVDIIIEVSGWMIDFMVLDYWFFLMVDFIMENGFKVKKLELVFFNLVMEKNMKEDGLAIKEVA